jgi:hypothetical protein
MLPKDFLGGFAKFRKATTSFVMSVCPFLPMEQLVSHWIEFYEISYFGIFRKSVEKIQDSLKYDKNNGQFTWRPEYTYDNIALSSSYNEKYFWQLCRENQNTHFIFKTFSRKSRRLWDNTEKYYTARQVTDNNIIRPMHIACWIIKATDTLTICNAYRFSTARIVTQTRLSVT